MLRLMLTTSASLAGMFALVTLLALLGGRALPGAGAIGFLSYRDGNSDIYVLDVVRRTLHNLTDNDAVNGHFAFSPDGTKIAFESNKDGNTEIYMMSVECHDVFDLCDGGIRQLTDDETDSTYPVWSPDSRQVAYVYDVSFEDSNNDIYVMDIESGMAFNLSDSPANDESPAWSPDGSILAFRSDRSENPTTFDYEIYVANRDGSDVRRLLEQSIYAREIAWSPDGSEVLLGTYDEYRKFDVAVVDSDGSNFQLLTNNPEQDFFSPTWSPDGAHMAFLIATYEIPNGLWLLDRNNDTIQQLSPDVRYGSPLAWSSDGRYLFFTMNSVPIDVRGDEIAVADVTTGSVQQLTSEGGTSPVWWP